MQALDYRPIQKLEPENWNTEFRQFLIQLAVAKVNDYHLAEDIVQDTFASAWQSRERFRGECSEKTFLASILKNKIIDFYRKRGRRPLVLATQIENEDSDDSTGWIDSRADPRSNSHPSTHLERQDFLDDLEHAVNRLPGKMGAAYRLWEMDDLSTEEVIERLNITTSNLWVLVHRAKKLLRTELNAEWSGARL